MTSLTPLVEPGWRYEKAADVATQLEALLARLGVQMDAASAFKQRVLDVLRIHELQASGGRIAVDDDVRAFFRNLVGVHELANLILAREKHPDFPTLIPHLRLLGDASAIQNAPSSGADGATNKLFELLVSMFAMECASNTELDHPIASRGTNPDVLSTYRGRRWGIACKVLHGVHPEGFLEHLTKGIEQVERSEAAVGTVLFNLKNVLPHDDFWPLTPTEVDTTGGRRTLELPGAWFPPDIPHRMLQEWVQGFASGIRSYLPTGHLEQLFAGKKCVPGLLFWCHVVSGVRINDKPTPASVRMMKFFSLGEVAEDDRAFLRCLDWAAHPDAFNRDQRPPA